MAPFEASTTANEEEAEGLVSESGKLASTAELCDAIKKMWKGVSVEFICGSTAQWESRLSAFSMLKVVRLFTREHKNVKKSFMQGCR